MIILVRHGQSLGQLWTGAYQNDETNFLSSAGVRQAEFAGEQIKGQGIEHIDFVFCSELTRAKQTMMSILQRMDMLDKVAPVINPAINEREFLAQQESIKSMLGRIIPYMDEHVIPLAYDNNVLLVSHYYVMKCIFHHYADMYDVDVKNADPYYWDLDTNTIRGEFEDVDRETERV